MSTDRLYLGDAVYVQLEEGLVTLTTENGVKVTNIIYLEPEVMDALDVWWTRIQEKYKSRTAD